MPRPEAGQQVLACPASRYRSVGSAPEQPVGDVVGGVVEDVASGHGTDQRAAALIQDAAAPPAGDGDGVAGDGAVDQGHRADGDVVDAAAKSERGVACDGAVDQGHRAEVEDAAAVGDAVGDDERVQRDAGCLPGPSPGSRRAPSVLRYRFQARRSRSGHPEIRVPGARTGQPVSRWPSSAFMHPNGTTPGLRYPAGVPFSLSAGTTWHRGTAKVTGCGTSSDSVLAAVAGQGTPFRGRCAPPAVCRLL